MEKSRISSLLEKNRLLHSAISFRLNAIRIRIEELETFEEFLLLHFSNTRKIIASRAPVDRKSVLKNQEKETKTSSAAHSNVVSCMQVTRKRKLHELSKNEEKEDRPEYYLNRYVPTKAPNGRLEDPFIDAGLCGSPHFIRVILRPYPESKESHNVGIIMSRYNLLKVPNKLSQLGIVTHGYFTRKKCEENSTVHSGFQETSCSFSSCVENTSFVNYFEEEKPAKSFKHFLDSENAKIIVEKHWEDKYTLQEHLKRQFAYESALEADLISARDDSSSIFLQLNILVDSVSFAALEYFADKIRAQKIGLCLPSTLFCSEAVIFIKRLQSGIHRTDLDAYCDCSLRKKIVRELLKSSEVFPKSRLLGVFAAFGV